MPDVRPVQELQGKMLMVTMSFSWRNGHIPFERSNFQGLASQRATSMVSVCEITSGTSLLLAYGTQDIILQ